MNDENLKPFKEGYDERRNYEGRPKGSRSLKSMLKELLSSQDPDGEWSKSVAGQLIRKAFRDGDMRAIQEIIDRIEGKVPISPLIDQSKHTHLTVELKISDDTAIPLTHKTRGDIQASR